MKNSEASTILKQLIMVKEAECKADAIKLKGQLYETFEKLKPINIIKDTFNDVTSSPDLKNNLMNAAMGITTGYVAKKAFTAGSHNPIRKLLGFIMEWVIASKVTKNADEIKAIAGIMLKKLISHNGKAEKLKE